MRAVNSISTGRVVRVRTVRKASHGRTAKKVDSAGGRRGDVDSEIAGVHPLSGVGQFR
jgi:hypothetical protein